MSFRPVGCIAAWLVVGCLACAKPPQHAPRSEAYDHIFEVVALIPSESGTLSPEIMRLREAEQAATADSRVAILPPASGIESLVEAMAESDGDYSQSLQATRIDDTTWELTLSTGGNTARDVSTYRTDGRTILPVRYERRAAMARSRRYVYLPEP